MNHDRRQRDRATVWTTRAAGIALVLMGASGTAAFAQTAGQGAQGAQSTQNAQPVPMPQGSPPMVKPPEAASGSSGSGNPDNMPIKRPDKPTNDRMMHAPPASGANAK